MGHPGIYMEGAVSPVHHQCITSASPVHHQCACRGPAEGAPSPARAGAWKLSCTSTHGSMNASNRPCLGPCLLPTLGLRSTSKRCCGARTTLPYQLPTFPSQQASAKSRPSSRTAQSLTPGTGSWILVAAARPCIGCAICVCVCVYECCVRAHARGVCICVCVWGVCIRVGVWMCE